MRHLFRTWLPGVILVFFLAACETATPSPTSSTAAVPSTIPAAASPAPTVTAAPSLTPTPSIILPHSVYYLAAGTDGKDQVWKIERDGTMTHPMTAVSSGIGVYDINPAASLLAYTTPDGLYLANADGSAPKKVFDIPPDDGTPHWGYLDQVTSLAWSPDGKILSYAQGGLKFYDPETSKTTTALENTVQNLDGNVYPEKLYSPNAWSPDSKMIVVNEDYLEGGSRQIYVIASKKLIPLHRTDQENACCNAAWSPDSASLFMTGIPYGNLSADMWMFDPETGAGTNLIPATALDGSSNYADFLKVVGANSLYFFYTNSPMDTQESTPLVMVSADKTSPTTQKILRTDKLFLYEALWAEDGSSAVVVQPAPGEPTSPFHGPIVLVAAANTPALPLAADGRLLRWGP